ncbi:MAG: ATP-binding cassette domain-containing protein [Cyclobacteriaceae bacterium]
MDLLKIENVSKAYSDHIALDSVSMSVPQGSVFGLLGPNGAGKTTLIRIITKIIDCDAGKIFLRDQAITPELVRRIGYLPEERGLYKKMKVGEQLIYLARLKGMSRTEAVQKIKGWLERLDLMEWHNKTIQDLSKGMAQKVQFIATVVHEPDLIILDEPFSGFDPVNANLIKDEILRLREQGTTVIFSTHRMESVEELCDHIALIDKSKKILDGKKVDIKQSHKDGTFIIEHEGDLSGSSQYDLIKSEKQETGLSQSFIRNKIDGSPNLLLAELLKEVQIHSFIEKVPSINEIFISKVKGGHDE